MKKELNDILKSNKKTAELYEKYREKFFDFIAINHNFKDRYVLEDIYQDSFMALVNALKKEREIKSLRAYLFEIGKNNLFSHFEREGKFSEIPNDDFLAELESHYTAYEMDRIQEIVSQHTIALQSPCKEVLNLYYWANKSMDEIARLLSYKNEQVAKNRKSLCMKKLRESVMKQIRMEGIGL